MSSHVKEFVKDAGEWGITSWAAGLVMFGIGIWEHTHEKPLPALVLLSLTVPLFWIGSYVAWAKKKCALEHEQSLHGGPEISLAWSAIPPLNTKRTLSIENGSDTDAYEVKVDDIGFNKVACAARFPIVPKCPKMSIQALNFELVGTSVPPKHKDDIEMVVYASGGDFAKDAAGKDVVEFPINVTFEEYGGARYEANFRFLADPYLEKVNIHRVSRRRLDKRLK